MTTDSTIAALERRLNDFDGRVRAEALDGLLTQVASGTIAFPEPLRAVNLHAHTFYSYNGYGYSPTYLAWRFRCEGIGMAGIVDFDVLDGVDEFRAAAGRVGIKACAGIETRVYFSEFGHAEINSPGEPGVAYHMGAGFVSGTPGEADFLDTLKRTAGNRTRQIMERVNAFLHPVALDYERDVVPRTPRGNATERHLCEAYEAKGVEVIPDENARCVFWAEKLGRSPEDIRKVQGNSPSFQGLIRSATMKQGGVGYVQPSGDDFPRMQDFNAFVLRCGAIPTVAWLDGLSPAEQTMERLLETAMHSGVAAINIIPDRNWNISNADVKRRKVDELDRVIALAESLDLPILVGTEMNAHGQKLVDDFHAPELSSYTSVFMAGAHVLYGHTRMQEAAGMGYTSDWARHHLHSANARNAFYRAVGETLAPLEPLHVNTEMLPDDVFASIAGAVFPRAQT
jgi:hypothetical protein